MIHSIEEKQYAFYIVRKLTVTNKKVQFLFCKKEHFFSRFVIEMPIVFFSFSFCFYNILGVDYNKKDINIEVK